MHLSILRNGIVSYTDYAGLEIPVDSAITLAPMGEKDFSGPPRWFGLLS